MKDKLIEWTTSMIIYYLKHYNLSEVEKDEYLVAIMRFCEGKLKRR